MQIPFIGQTYENRVVSISNQKCVNYYPEIEPGDARNVIALQPVSGTQLFATIVDSSFDSIRALHFNEKNQKLYVVDNTDLYEVDEVGNVSSSLGAIGGGTISMTDNGDDIVITTGTTYYYYDISAGTLGTVANGLNADDCTFQDGYIVYTESGTDKWHWSNVTDAQTIDALSSNQSNASVDLLVGIAQVERRLWVFGTDSITIWYNSGEPWALVEGGSSNGYGLAGKKAKTVIDSRVYWASNDGKIYVSNGYTPHPISHYGVENSMREYGNISDCHASSWSENGHKFVAFNFPSGDETWVYDVTSQMWHQRSSYVEGNTIPGVWSGIDVTRAWRKNIVGDTTYGRLGRLDVDLYTEYGGELVGRRTSPVIHSNQEVVTHDRLELLFNSGDTKYTAAAQQAIFTEIGNSESLTKDLTSSGNYSVTALSSTRIALFEYATGLKALDWDGTNWTQVGNTLATASIGAETSYVSIDKLSSTRIAWIGSTEDDLRSFDFDGTDWTQHSSDLNISPFANGDLTAINSTDVAITNGAASEWIRTYRLTGTTWAQVGNTFSLTAGVRVVSCTAMSSTRIAVFDNNSDNLTAYDWDGTDWTKTGNSFAIEVEPAGQSWLQQMAALTSSSIVLANYWNNKLETYDFDGTDWIQLGQGTEFGTDNTSPDIDLLDTDTLVVTRKGQSASDTDDSLKVWGQSLTNPSPTVQLRWSDDGGNTWGNWVDRPIGAIGEYRNRAVWYRLGQAQNRVYDMRISDDTSRSLIDAVLEGDGGNI